jgi:hypothetical protein
MESNGALIMYNNDKNISIAEAKSTHESLVKIEKDTSASKRPTLWLNFIISSLYGMGIFPGHRLAMKTCACSEQ